MIDLGRHNILGTRVDAVDYDTAVQRILSAAELRRPLATTALAVHGIMTGVGDREHRHRLNRMDLVVPDGQPVRWALGALHKAPLADRVYGPTLMLATCRSAAQRGMPIFLYGSSLDTLDRLREHLTAQFPQLRIAGVLPSKFRRLTSAEKHEVVSEIRDSGARITFVGLGCPRQEVWCYEYRDELKMPLLAVGAAFAFHAKQLPQAPQTMQRHGLEWLYRLWCEPRRLWRRYLLLNPAYLALLALQWSHLSVIDPDNTERPTEELLHG